MGAKTIALASGPSKLLPLLERTTLLGPTRFLVDRATALGTDIVRPFGAEQTELDTTFVSFVVRESHAILRVFGQCFGEV